MFKGPTFVFSHDKEIQTWTAPDKILGKYITNNQNEDQTREKNKKAT